MHSRWLERHPLTVFLVVTTVGLVAWVAILFAVWALVRLVGVDPSYWAMVEALSTAVAAAAVLGAGFVASRELNELSASRHLEVADRLFSELNSAENIAARRWVYQNLPAKPAEGMRTMTPEGQAAVKTVLNSLDRVAFLTQSDWIPEEMIMPWLNPMVVKAWQKLGPYVAYESRRRHEPDYYSTARELAERCQAWRRTHVAGAEITWVEDAL
jgi:hypothetical protein